MFTNNSLRASAVITLFFLMPLCLGSQSSEEEQNSEVEQISEEEQGSEVEQISEGEQSNGGEQSSKVGQSNEVEQISVQKPDRGSIPEELLRPRRGELPRYPMDTVIGELGQGSVSGEAYSFANLIASGLLSGQMDNSGINSISAGLRENYLAMLEQISPQSVRLGGGKEEADGAVSFLIRFIGKEQGIMGELFIRLHDRQREQNQGEEVQTRTARNWVFDELILEEAKSRDVEQKETLQRFDFSPYERFF